MFDHWRSWKDFSPDPESPRRRGPYYPDPPRGPRLNMAGYKYPPSFNLGGFERVRQLNLVLLKEYRRIGTNVDRLAKATEDYEHYKKYCDYYAQELGPPMLAAKEKLQRSLAFATVLIAELKAVGATYHIPDVLQDKIKVKDYVLDGSLAFLPGVNNYHSEVLADLNVPADRKPLLRRISFHVNRLKFLTECGGIYVQGRFFADMYKCLRRQFKELQDSNFQMDLLPRLMKSVNEILAKEPAMVRAEREEEERRQMEKLGDVQVQGQEGEGEVAEADGEDWDVDGAVQVGGEVAEADGDVDGAVQVGAEAAHGWVQVGVEDADGEVQVGGEEVDGEVDGEDGEDFLLPEVKVGGHTRFYYSSDEDHQEGVLEAGGEVDGEDLPKVKAVHIRFHYSSDEE